MHPIGAAAFAAIGSTAAALSTLLQGVGAAWHDGRGPARPPGGVFVQTHRERPTPRPDATELDEWGRTRAVTTKAYIDEPDAHVRIIVDPRPRLVQRSLVRIITRCSMPTVF